MSVGCASYWLNISFSIIFQYKMTALQLASSPREVAAAVDVTLVMMADPVAALAVALGPDGAVAGLTEGKLHLHLFGGNMGCDPIRRARFRSHPPPSHLPRSMQHCQ